MLLFLVAPKLRFLNFGGFLIFFNIIFFLKHNVYKQMRLSIIGKENAWEARGGVEKE